MDALSSIRRALPSLRASAEPVDLGAYGRDLWPRHHLDVRAGRAPGAPPAAAVWPRTTEEVAAVVRLCRDEGWPLVPFGAGSGVCAGVLPGARAIVLDLKAMAAERALFADAPAVEVEAGALGITFEEGLERRGYTAGHFPSSILCSTVGGWLAARGAGQCSGKYGKIEDMVAGLEFVDGRGEAHVLRRRTTGADLTPLLVGSEGTLGVITAATLRLHPAPAARAYRAFAFPSFEAGAAAIREAYQAGLRPAVTRLYDPFDTLLARASSRRKGGRHGGGPGAGERALRAALRSPALFNQLAGAAARALGGRSLLVLVFEGAAGEVAEDAARADRLCEGAGARPLGEGPARRWFAHRYSVSYRQAPVFRAGLFSDTFEVAAPWARVAGVYEAVRRALGRHVFVMAHLSHAYPDGSSLYFTFAGSAPDDGASAALYDRAWRDALDAAVGAGATISHHHGVGRSKAPRLGAELGLGVEVVSALRRAFDPAGLFNPGALAPTDEGGRAPAPPDDPSFQVDEASLLVRAPADMTLGELRRRLHARALRLPAEGHEGLRIDAWLAAGLPGAPDPWADPVARPLAGLDARMPSGRVLHVATAPRRAVGPDLLSLFVGTKGPGRLLSATLRVEREGAGAARPTRFRFERDAPIGAGEAALWGHVRRELERL
ncbi:MAG TPA: FAD-binding oxidoreductase [Polyangiaceae bacterium]|nr:FAD-binding oxidoreductase [Polyangiaceae bacterium]